jgi:acetolactate synthase-1/2/3 large subunit
MAGTTSDLLWRTLRDLGADCVFGIPGSQTSGLFEALSRSGLRTIVPTHELAGSFMANGYARASGRPGVLSTIPGPGFTYALTGLAEARLDSAPLILVVPAALESAEREHLLQAIDQRAIAAPLVKRIVRLTDANSAAAAVAEAYHAATEGEPGPVLLEIGPGVLKAESSPGSLAPPPVLEPSPADVDRLVARLNGARRVLLYVGAGALDAAETVRAFVDRLGAAVATTTTGRGVVPEDHPAVVVRDPGLGCQHALNRLVRRADLVLALGSKFSHNGAAGFGLSIDPATLVTVNAAGPSQNYPASLHITGDVRRVLAAALPRLARHDPAGGWDRVELDRLRREREGSTTQDLPEPRLGGSGIPVGEAIRELAASLPSDAIVVTDSGLHQMCVRRHFPVRAPRGLIVPTDFQSMGFALPAAIGAALAAPSRRVVAVLGDGGLMMSALELATAVRERIDLTVILFNDAAYGLIRQVQLADFGAPYGTDLVNPDFEALAGALGVEYRSSVPGGLAAALDRPRSSRHTTVRLIEVPLRDAPAMRRIRFAGTARRMARAILPTSRRRRLKSWLGR